MSIDLSKLSIKELKALITTAKKEHTRLSKRAPITKVREKLAKVASAEGYTLVELFGGAIATRMPRAAAATAPAAPAAKKTAAVVKRGRKPGAKAGRKLGKVPPKYRNPADPKETWTGRGKQPRWLATLVAKGRKPEEFLIKAPRK